MTQKANIVFDATALSLLQACPRKYDFRMNHNWEEESGKSNALECGSLVHIILEFFNKSLIAGKSRTDSIIIGMEAGQEFRVPYSESNKYVLDKEHRGML